MNSKSLSIVVAGAVLAMIGAGFVTSSFAALQAKTVPLQRLQASAPQHARELKLHPTTIQVRKIIVVKRASRKPIRAWRLGLRDNKHLTSNDARIITKAALLMHNRKQMKVGDIATKRGKYHHKLYVINLESAKGKLVRQVVMNAANGHIRPLRLKRA